MSDGEPPGDSQWPRAGDLEAVIRAVGHQFDADWSANSGPDVTSVRDSDTAVLYGGLFEARRLADAFLVRMRSLGFTDAEFPQLSGRLDARDRPMVVIGALSAQTMARLMVVLNRDARTAGETRPIAVGPGVGGVTFGVELDAREV